MRHATTVAVGGVVASLSLAVALTVMVTSFRGSMMEWLDAVLPAPMCAPPAAPAVSMQPCCRPMRRSAWSSCPA
jgi:hypothetical protein